MAVFNQAMATHLRAGEIIVRRLDCSSLEFEITVVVYTDTGSDVKFGEGFLTFGDGSDPVQLPQIENTTRSDLGDEVGTASFTITHNFPSAGRYKIGYQEPNRNEGILNIDNSVNTTFYVETEIIVGAIIGCNNSPVLQIPPIDRACPGVAFFHNPGAYDPDGDSLSFEMVIPKMDQGINVVGYEDPDDNIFYPSTYGQGNETADGPPSITIDAASGELKWDAPSFERIGEYNVAFVVKEFRLVAGQWRQIGYVTRDMQIIVEDCENERPELEIPEDICVEAGELIQETIIATDPDGDPVKVEAASPIFSDPDVSLDPDSVFRSSPLNVDFQWATECNDIRAEPYQVFFKVTDDPPEGPGLPTFATWNITIVGPAPELVAATQENQSIVLDWTSYSCANASSIQIWRRVDSNPYVPEDCETGIRENSGYSLITEVNPDAVTYRDNDLAPGAKYCYRLVAVFPDPFGGESIVSDEVCAEPSLATEPVITKVSVAVTDETNGQIQLEWMPPFDKGDLTYPLQYKIYRAEGQSNTPNTLITPTNIVVEATDPELTTFTDTGLNTKDLAYNYKVVLEDGSDEIESFPASSVRLTPVPELNRIRLEWDAIVPWTNYVASPPEDSRHLIFRGEEGDTEDELILIDEVDVIENGFVYIDSGQFNDTPLRDDRLYCYRVMTKGTYGNPDIYTPLENYSQIICAQPTDTVAPCKPILTLQERDCSDIGCDLNDFSNEITWEVEFVGECKVEDLLYYEIFYASTTESEFELVGTSRTESFTHNNLNSFKGCYKVRAVDRSGNVSEFSDESCVDNCPYYELPNLLTPNGDQCNDIFSAFGKKRNLVDENGQSLNSCGIIDESKCARFVEAVDFTVFNRWGGKVYEYKGVAGTENGIYIDWDGRDNTGKALSSGVYYYLAEVTFDVVDPSQAKKQIKGWVQIMR